MPSFRYVAGVVLVAAASYGAAKLGQTLRSTASVGAIRPAAGAGIAVLCVWGMRWWPGVLLGAFAFRAELLLTGSGTYPVASVLGQEAAIVAEVVVGALLLRRLAGPDAAMDRVEQVGRVLVALAVAAAIGATAGTVSMITGGVVDGSGVAGFWRTWWLGDTVGALLVVPLVLAWAHRAGGVRRRLRSWEGAAAMATVGVLSIVAFSTDEPIRYAVFPALIWAAFRFGPRGATLAVAITAGVAIGATANDVGPFFDQPIDRRTLDTQLYVWIAALTTLFLAGAANERERSSAELADVRRREGAGAVEERRRIARELHDSVAQALFSAGLYARTGQRALAQEGGTLSGRAERSLGAIADLTTSAQSEMRALLEELHRDPVHGGLVTALARHASGLHPADGLRVDVRGPEPRLALPEPVEAELFAIGREALVNVEKHARASTASVRVEAARGRVVVEVRDDGRGFDPAVGHPGHFGLDSMRTRAAEIGGSLAITSAPGSGTLVRVSVPSGGAEAEDALATR